MLTSVRYCDQVGEMKDAYNHRLRLSESAKQRGIKPTARLFGTTVPTVRKWLRRFQQRGPTGLMALPRARHHQSQKTPPTIEAQLVELRKTPPTLGSRRLIREFDLPISHRALERIWREHGLLKNAAGNINASRTSRTSKLPGRCSSKSAQIPRISTIFRATGCRPSGSTCRPFNTPPAMSAVA